MERFTHFAQNIHQLVDITPRNVQNFIHDNVFSIYFTDFDHIFHSCFLEGDCSVKRFTSMIPELRGYNYQRRLNSLGLFSWCDKAKGWLSRGHYNYEKVWSCGGRDDIATCEEV